MKTKSNQGIKVLIAGSILQFLLGIIYVWGVFVTPVSEHLSWDVANVKLTSSYMLCFFAIGILIGGKAQVKIGTSKSVLVGGLCMAAGTLFSSFISSSTPSLIYITYGIVGGLGVGIAYNAIISTAPRWFPEKKGLVTGISVFSFGLATVVFAPLVEALIPKFGITNTFRILAAVFFVATLLLFRFIVMPEVNGGAAAGALAGKKQYTTGEMLKTKQFLFIFLGMMIGTATYFVLNPSFKTLPGERGMTDSAATMLVMFTGIANAFGRLAFPLLSDKIGRINSMIVNFAATGLGAVMLIFSQTPVWVAAIFIIVFCYGGVSGVFPLITGEYFGAKHQGSNYGMVMLGFALSSLLFPRVIGVLESDMAKYVTLALISLAGVLLFIILPRLKVRVEERDSVNE